jgi:hypothetical protein
MGWFSDILKEYPALAGEIERLRLMEAENKKRQRENAALRNERKAEQKPEQFREFKGALWRERNGTVDTIAYCPSCEFAMTVFPPGSNEMIVCSKCNFIAPFQPGEIETLARAVETELLSL